MAKKEVKQGNVVILGVQGSGKTVFLSILGHTFAQGGAYGLFLTANGNTDNYIRDCYDLMRHENEWPQSTTEGKFVELSWQVRDGTTTLFTINSIDCAGEEIVKALGLSEGKEDKKPAKKTDADDDDAWGQNEDEKDDGERDVKKLIAERVANASVVCLFINPNDFEERIYANEDFIGGPEEVKGALKRSRDMRQLLQAILDDDAAGAAQRIVLTITQSGKREVSNQIEELGGAKKYLFMQDRQLAAWSGLEDANIIAVSAVNRVVFKRKDGSVVSPDEIGNYSEKELERDFEIMKPWKGRKDGTLHVVPREKPDVEGENSSSGLIEFLLSVGGPLSSGLSILDEALRDLRDCQYEMSSKRMDEFATAKDRLAAAECLAESWKKFYKASKEYCQKGKQRRESWPATKRYLDEEESQLLRWVVAEREIDAYLRERAAGRGMATGVAESLELRINEAIEAAWQADGLHNCPCLHATFYDLGITQEWLESQIDNHYKGGREAALQKFDNAIKSNDSEGASVAIDDVRKWGVPEEVAEREQALERSIKFAQAAKDRMAKCKYIKYDIDVMRRNLGEVKALISDYGFEDARKLQNQQVSASKTIANKLDTLESEKENFGDGASIAALREDALRANKECENVAAQIEEAERDYRFEQTLAKIDNEIDTAAAKLSDGATLINVKNYEGASSKVVQAKSSLFVAVKELNDVGLPANDGRIVKRMKRIDAMIRQSEKAEKTIAREIAGAVRRKRVVKIVWATIAASAAIFCSIYLYAAKQAKIREQIQGEWSEARQLASQGKFAAAAEIIGGYSSTQAKMLGLTAHEVEDFATRMSLGTDYCNISTNVMLQIKSLDSECRAFISDRKLAGREEKYAPNEWREFQQNFAAAHKIMPLTTTAEYGLPSTAEETKRDIDAYLEAKKRVDEAKTALASFMKKTINAQDEAIRKERIAELRSYLESIVPPQGWDTLASALPKEGIEQWLDQPELALARNKRDFLATGLPPGARQVKIDGIKALKAFEEVHEKATAEEWRMHFAEIEADCKMVVAAIAKIDEEIARRKRISGNIGDAQIAIENKQWRDAEELVKSASQNLISGRKSDAADRSELEKLNKTIHEGRSMDAVDEVENLLRQGKLRAAALKSISLTSISDNAAKRLATVRESIKENLVNELSRVIDSGLAESVDFYKGTRFCFDVADYDSYMMAALDGQVNKLCPKNPAAEAPFHWNEIEALRKALSGSDMPGIKTMADKIANRLESWRIGWMKDAEQLAKKVSKETLITANWQNAEKVEKYLALSEKAGTSTVDIDAVRQKLPPLLRVSLYEADGKTPVDIIDSMVASPRKRHALIMNDLTKKNDLLLEGVSYGATMRIAFQDKEKTSAVIPFSWHGCRHIKIFPGTGIYQDMQ